MTRLPIELFWTAKNTYNECIFQFVLFALPCLCLFVDWKLFFVDHGPASLSGDSFVDLLKCFHLKRGSPVQFSRLPIAKMMKAFKSRTQVNLAKDRNYVLSLNDTERESFTVQQSQSKKAGWVLHRSVLIIAALWDLQSLSHLVKQVTLGDQGNMRIINLIFEIWVFWSFLGCWAQFWRIL